MSRPLHWVGWGLSPSEVGGSEDEWERGGENEKETAITINNINQRMQMIMKIHNK